MENSLNDVFSRRPGNETDFNSSWNRIVLLRDADQAERALRLVRVTQKDDPVPGAVEVRLVPGSPRKDIVQRVFHYYSSGGADRCREVYHGSGPGGFGGDPLQMYSKNLSLHVDGQSSSPS